MKMGGASGDDSKAGGFRDFMSFINICLAFY